MENSFFLKHLSESDPDLYNSISLELGRQRNEIELIASENIVSRAVMEAQGSVMTNKYAEGYAGRRYYGGCQYVDIAETLAIDRACRLDVPVQKIIWSLIEVNSETLILLIALAFMSSRTPIDMANKSVLIIN